MGLFHLLSSSSCDRRDPVPTLAPAAPPAWPLPDATRYEILRHRQIGSYLVISLRYLDCTNYEGLKTLLYADCTLAELQQQQAIDPHFSPNPQYHSPIARFIPTADGWAMAVGLAKGLHSVTLPKPKKRHP